MPDPVLDWQIKGTGSEDLYDAKNSAPEESQVGVLLLGLRMELEIYRVRAPSRLTVINYHKGFYKSGTAETPFSTAETLQSLAETHFYY